MLYRDIFKVMSLYLFGFSLSLLAPLCLAFYYQFYADARLHPQPHSTWAFFFSLTISLFCAGIFYFLSKESKGILYRKEGFVVVSAIWLITPAMAALPFGLSGTLKNPLQAYFEMASGFTTTGISTMQAKKYAPDRGKEELIEVTIPGLQPVVYQYYGNIEPVRDPVTHEILYEGIEAVSQALLFWRSMTQWLGGMGVVVLFVAILPALGVGGRQLFQAEATGPIKESLTPRITETALHLWKIYLGLTILQIGVLKWVAPELSFLDLTTITFSTLATGGFSVLNDSLGGYHSLSVERVVMLFMILGSINFALYFAILRGKIYSLIEPEFFLFIVLVLISGGLAASFLLWQGYGNYTFSAALHYGFFHVISSMTTTGFATTTYELWPYSVQAVMLIVMYLGGMSGSTTGGMKTMRVYMIFQICKGKIESLFRPESVRLFKVRSTGIDDRAASLVLCYFVTLIAVSVFSTFIFIVTGIDPESSLSLVTSLINNVGIQFGVSGGASGSVAFMSNGNLILSSLLMILGRLEFFALLTILIPAFWREDS
jgi:trk system potassium uptake protein